MGCHLMLVQRCLTSTLRFPRLKSRDTVRSHIVSLCLLSNRFSLSHMSKHVSGGSCLALSRQLSELPVPRLGALGRLILSHLVSPKIGFARLSFHNTSSSNYRTISLYQLRDLVPRPFGILMCHAKPCLNAVSIGLTCIVPLFQRLGRVPA